MPKHEIVFQLANIRPTTASDVYAFVILAWEVSIECTSLSGQTQTKWDQVFAGQVPFPDKSKVAGVCWVVEGRRLGRPDHAELSDRMWKMIKGCWKDNPAQRKMMAEVVTVLEPEVGTHQSQRHALFPPLFDSCFCDPCVLSDERAG